MTLNDPQKMDFGDCFLQSLAAAHISTVNCDEMAGDRPRQPDIKFLALNVDVSSLSPDPLS